MSILKMTELNLENKRVLIREDFNVPLQDGKITSDARIRAALYTIEYAHKAGAKIMLMSHLGRPKQTDFDSQYSLAPVAEALSHYLKVHVRLERNWLNGIDLKPHEIVLCENVRFCPGETKNDEALSRQMASLTDIFVMDAFGVAHRAHASTCGVAHYAPIACAGPLLVSELEALGKALENPDHPVVSIVAGSKVSTKLHVLEAVCAKSDELIVGGGIANTFLCAKGFPIGKSLYEPELVEEAKQLIYSCKNNSTGIPLPSDVVTAKEFSSTAPAIIKKIEDVAEDDLILDIGPETAQKFAAILANAKTIIWNGPVGVFEMEAFSQGTEVIAKAIAASDAFSIAGGGDTLAAIEKFGVTEDISYISTGGGAFLEFLQGKKLPAVAILEQRALLHSMPGRE